jgi:tetratricopeptide (TPR) repeat protein
MWEQNSKKDSLKDSLEECRRATELAPDQIGYWRTYVFNLLQFTRQNAQNAKEKDRLIAKAEATINRAVKLNSDSPVIRELRGMLFEARAQTREARHEYKSAVKTCQECLMFTRDVVKLYDDEENYRGAIGTYVRALKVYANKFNQPNAHISNELTVEYRKLAN